MKKTRKIYSKHTHTHTHTQILPTEKKRNTKNIFEIYTKILPTEKKTYTAAFSVLKIRAASQILAHPKKYSDPIKNLCSEPIKYSDPKICVRAQNVMAPLGIF